MLDTCCLEKEGPPENEIQHPQLDKDVENVGYKPALLRVDSSPLIHDALSDAIEISKDLQVYLHHLVAHYPTDISLNRKWTIF